MEFVHGCEVSSSKVAGVSCSFLYRLKNLFFELLRV
jgi:hypothetical protein